MFHQFKLIPNDFRNNQFKLTALQAYCEKLNLSPAKAEIMRQLFQYAEMAFCSPREKQTDTVRYNSFNTIIMSLDKSNLKFLDTVLAEIGEVKNFLFNHLSPTNPIARLIVRDSKLMTAVAPIADRHRKNELKTEAGWLLGVCQALCVMGLSSFIYNSQHEYDLSGNRIALNPTLFHTVISNLITATLLLASVAIMLYSRDLVGASRVARAIPTWFTNSTHQEGVITNLPDAPNKDELIAQPDDNSKTASLK